MKKLVVFLFVVVLNASTFANDTKPVKDVKSTIRTQIVKLLGKANFSIENETKTFVDFIINKNGQLIVLNVDSNDSRIESYVKNKLNYQFVTSTKVAGKVFKMPLTLKNE